MKTTINTTKQMRTSYKWLFVLLFMGFGFISRGQGSESFESANLPGSYSDGSFVGDNSVTWNYVESRDDAGYEITNEGIMLRRSSDNSKVYSESVSGGIGDFTCKLKKAYTGSGNRQVELFINGISKGTSIAWDDTNVQTFSVSGINITGNIVIEIRNITSKQVVVDDISWTGYANTSPTITVTPTSLTGFTYVEGNGPSAEQSFTVEGSNLTNDISVTPPTNWEISTTSGGPYQTTAITLTQSGGTVSSTTIYTRMVGGLTNANSPFSGDIACESSGATTINVAVDGTVDAAVSEIQTQMPDGTDVACGFTYDFGDTNTGSTTTQTLRIKNVGTADLLVTSYPLSGSDASEFSISPASTSTTIAAGTYYDITVGFSPTTGGAKTAKITINSDDSDEGTCEINLAGNGLAPCTEPNQATAITFPNTTASAIDVSYTAASGGADNYLVVQSTSSSLSASPVDGTTYSVGTALGGGTVVYNDSGTSFTDSGLSSNTTYYYYVFAYNDASCGGGPNYNTTSLDGNETTQDAPDVFISEIAGKGLGGEWKDEYIELVNNSNYSVSLNGWKLLYYEGGSSPEKTITFGSSDNIPANDAFVIAVRTTHTAALTPDYVPSSSFSLNDPGYVVLKDDSGAVFDEAGSSSDKFAKDINYEFTDCTNDNKPVANWDNLGTTDGTPGVVNCVSLDPEIEIQGNAVEILDGDTTPSVSDDTDFGNVEVSGGSTSHTFTIKNTGGADLTVNGITSDNTEFAVSGTTSGTIAAGGSSTFTVTFDPTALGVSSATITVDNDDADENPYDFSIQGAGTNSNLSDIVKNGGTTNNILYANYQNMTITSTSNSTSVFRFKIRDGGDNAPDADNLSTELTDITFQISAGHYGYIRSAALFKGNALVDDSPNIDTGNGTISFSGLSGTNVTAPDDDIRNLTLRVTFTENVVDNEQLRLTIISAMANAAGSVFATSDAGGAQSSITGDKNRIEVVADRIRFTIQPTDQIKSTNLAPFEIQALDAYNVLDKDATNQIDLTTSGTGMTSSTPYTMANGKVTINDVQFSDAQNGITLTATTTGLTDNDDVSTTFDILDVVDGAYRTTSDGTWKSTAGGTANWDQFTGGSWTALSGQPPANTSNQVYIFHDITLQGTNTASDITVESGGTLSTSGVSQTLTKLLVKTGGTYNKQANGVKVNSGGFIEVEDGGTFTFKHTNNTSLSSNLWNGDEKFHAGSNFIIKETDNTANFQFMEFNTDVSEFNGGQFGNLIVDLSGGKLLLLPDAYNGTLTKNDLIIKNIADNIKFCKDDATCVIKGNLEIQSTVDQNITITTKEKTATLTVEGDFIHNGTKDFRLANSNGIDPNVTLNIYGDLSLSGTSSKFRPDISSDGTGTNEINLQGDLSINEASILYSENDNTTLNFTGTGDGLTPETTQTIDIASTDANENKNIQFNVQPGAYVQMIHQDFELGKDSKLTVNAGGVFDFGFDGTTPLIVTKSGSQTGTKFELKQGGYLKITSPDGIMSDSSAGNVQVVASNTSFSPIATFHYIGKSDQVTGDAIGSSSNGRAVIVEMETNSLSLTPSQSFGITDATNANINNNLGGILDIRSGKFLETTSEYITGTAGQLKMAAGTTYVIPYNSDNNSDYIPRMDGTYDLTAGSTIELSGSGAQILRGQRAYKDLTFSNAGTKTISSAITDIQGDVYIKDDAIVDVENKTFGGVGTGLLMENNAKYITAGTGTKPDARGSYILDDDSTIEFTNSESSIELVRLEPEYVNIIVNGSSVGSNTLTSSIKIQTGGSFTVKNGATFKFKKADGFNGTPTTIIDNTNSPTITLQPGSTIEYKGDNQSVTQPNSGYQNLTISGSGDKTLSPAEVIVKEDLTVTSSRLLLEDNKGIEVQGDVVNDGAIEVNNQGAFVQTDDAGSISGTGTFKMNKTSLPLNHYYDYVYWSSPINSSTFTLADMVTGAWRYYKYDPNEANNGHTYPSWVMLSASDVPEAGSGYAVSAPTGAGAGTILNVQFTKGSDAFNNGVISRTVLRKGGPDDNGNYNLLGNPYPSAIDFDTLANDTDNDEIANSYSLWTNCRGFDANNHHQTTGYATYTASGTGTSACTGDDPANRYIASGQGFMIEANTDGGTMKFKNIYRVTDQNDHFLNRPQQRDILWLDMQDDAGNYSQIAVGFYTGATQAYDDGFDAHSINTGSGFALYSLINEEKLVIQGLPEWNSVENVVPLGVESDNTRNIRFHINRTEGLFGTYIYLHDKELNITHDLTASDYVTNVLSGSLDNRFELVFTPQPMHQEEQQINPNVVLLTQNQGVFDLKAQDNHQITGLKVYDISGRVLFENNQMNTANYQMNLKQVATGNLLLFQVQLDNQSHLVKKTIKE